MRRLISTSLVFVLVAAACGDDGTDLLGSSTTTTSEAVSTTTSTTTAAPSTSAPPSTTTQPEWPGESFSPKPLPDVVIAHDDVYVTRVSSAAVDPADWMSDILITDHAVMQIRMATDGTIVTQEIVPIAESDTRAEVAVYSPNGGRRVVEGSSLLFDVATIDGLESIIVDRADRDARESPDLVAVPLDGSALPLHLGTAAAPLFGVTGVDWAAGRGVLTAWADQSEWVGYRTVDGELDLPSPTDDLAYNSPPYVTAATLSPDGSIVYWAEGPDGGFDPETGEQAPVPREWRVRSMDLATGEERLDYPVSDVVDDPEELGVHSLHHTGEHLVINRRGLVEGERAPLRPLVLDFTYEEPDLYELPLEGIATPVPVR